MTTHGVDRDSTVVDLGAGTGRFAIAIAPHVGRLVAVDVSPAMLSRLQARAAEAEVTGPDGNENIETVRAGLLSYQHSGGPVDAVHTRNTLHQLPDAFKAVALHRIARMLRPGGVLLGDLAAAVERSLRQGGRFRGGAREADRCALPARSGDSRTCAFTDTG